MPWYFFALLAPAVWGMANHFDKYIIARYIKTGDPGASILFSGVCGVAVSIIVVCIAPQVVHTPLLLAFLIILNGMLLTASYIPYLYALAIDEASVIGPLFQLITVFVYILGVVFLHESLTPTQLCAGLLIILGAVIISVRHSEKKVHVKKAVIGLMTLSSLSIAVNSIIFKTLAEHTNFWTTAFWEYLGVALFAVILFVIIPRYRNEFVRIVRANGTTVLSISLVGELLSALGRLSFNFAALLVPVALVSIVSGFQPVFILLYGTLLTVFVPHISSEDISLKFLAQKIIAVALMIVGTILLIRL